MKSGIAAAGLAALLGGLALAAQPPQVPPATTAAAQQPSTQSRWEGLLQRLGSDEFAERDAAQRELDKAGVKERDLLKRLLAGVTDEEVKARIEGRLETIEESMLTNPEPVTLSLKDATLGEMAAALSKATGARINSWPEDRFNGNGRKRYSIEAHEKPFWEVFLDLSRQGGLSLQGWDGFKITQQDPGARNICIFGALAVIPGTLTRSTSVDLQAEPGKQLGKEQLSFNYMVALDPRIAGSQYTQPAIYKVVDDAGNILWEQPRDKEPQFWDGNTGNRGVWSSGLSLKIPAKPGQKIVSMVGDVRVKVVLRAEKMTLTELDQQVKKGPVTFGGIKFTLGQWKPEVNSVSFQFNTASMAAMVMGGKGPSLQVAVFDAENKQVWGTTMSGNSGHGGSFGFNDAKQPFHLELSVARKTKEVVFPFELKDLPLP